MHTEVHHRQIRGTRLGLLSIRLHIAAYSSPRIDLIRKVNWHCEIVERYAVQVGTLRRAVIGISLAGSGWGRRYGGIVVGASITERGSRLLILRHCSLQVLVRDVDLLLQDIQLRILKDFPPVTAQVLVIRLRGFPIPHLLVGWGNRNCGCLVLWSDGTARERQRRSKNPSGIKGLPHQRRHLHQTIHWGSPGSAACTIVTC